MFLKKCARKLVRIIKDFILDLQATRNFMLKKKKKRSEGKIKVGFLCQYVPAWNKSLLVYEKLKKDSRFEVFILCVPDRIDNCNLQNPDDLSNDTYEYFIKNGYDAVNLLVGKNQWLDLETLELDYIFYTRPYNFYMPKEYSSRRVSKYTKICVLLYAMTLSKMDIPTMLNRDFFRNVYCYFAETQYSKRYILDSYKIQHLLKLRKTVCYGMPALEDILLKSNEKGKIWKFASSNFKIMWTPRWTTDLEHGGSNFFVYKDFFLKYVKANKDVDVLIRPHPLTFPNFIKTGEMTEKEVDEYKKEVKEISNTFLDEEKEYVATFWESNVLVSDISGMIPEYFVMGKPIIFCVTNSNYELGEHFEKILEGCYNVHNESELENCLKELKHGNDFLKDIREKIKNDLFGEELEKASDRIVNELWNSKD